MNRYRAFIAGAWALAAAVALASIAAWFTMIPSVARGAPPSYGPAGAPAPPDTTGLAAGAADIRDHDPFRSERKPE